MKKTLYLLCAMLALASVACSKGEEPQDEPQKSYYWNPVIGNDCPDPTVIDDRARTGYFYAFSTKAYVAQEGRSMNIPIYKSENMWLWEPVGEVFPDGIPTWSGDGAYLWAPDINYVEGKYILYYALGHWNDGNLSAVGVAVADHPAGPYVDKGMVVDMKTTHVYNSIDPMLFVDGDKKYLYWGSYGTWKDPDTQEQYISGIWVVELEKDCLKVKAGCKPVQIGYQNMEGTYIIKRNGYYYFFGSKGSCCSNENSTYHIITARSTSPLGPFVSKDGQSLMSSNYEQTIMKNSLDGVFRGTGHNAQIITDDAGKDWMFYHSYESKSGFKKRCMLMDAIVWDSDGWPRFECGMWPSSKYEVPTIKKL